MFIQMTETYNVMSSSGNIAQQLFTSPDVPPSSPQFQSSDSERAEQTINLNKLEQDIEQSLMCVQKEMHQKRIQSLRRELEYINLTNWQFDTTDKSMRHKKEESDNEDEEFLAQELLGLEIANADEEVYEYDNTATTQADVLERTGVVTYLSENHGLIDGMLYFDYDCTAAVLLSVSEKVRYLAQKGPNDNIKVVKVIQTLGPMWDDEEVECDEKGFQIREHTIIGKVNRREERIVVLEDGIQFNMDDVKSSVVPVKGDWLELCCRVQWDEDNPCNVQKKEVIEVLSMKPLRSRISTCKIQQWNGTEGTCHGQIVFNKHVCQPGFTPVVGVMVIVQAIESDQGHCTWRAINLVPAETFSDSKEVAKETDEEEVSYDIEDQKNIQLMRNIVFDNVDFNDKKSITVEVKNDSKVVYILLKWKLMSSRQSSQLIIEPFLNRKVCISPGNSLTFTITCRPKVLGTSKELFVLVFNGFQVKRYISMNIVNPHVRNGLSNKNGVTNQPFSMDMNKNAKTIQQRRQNQSLVPGIRPKKPPAFVPVKLGGFPIPDKIWNAVLGDSNETIYSNDFEEILFRIEKSVPCLSAQLNITNYTERWHALLYIEEIQQNMQMRHYDMSKVFLIPSDEYLKLEIEGLSEKRPSLMCGDFVYAKDIWNRNVPDYEGYIHSVKGDTVFLKFSPEFHNRYTGYDIQIEFHFSRSMYRKRHQAVNLALSHLGPDILLPSHTVTTRAQLVEETILNISWFNRNLNPGQKDAVKNILSGISRPMPYCIFGPPGTGKTVTVVETVLQILSNIPDSRILIATPSNSSANLLTERLIQYENQIAGSLIRLIAHHLVDSETLPDVIKPYCATLDIAREETAKSEYTRNTSGINISCRSNFIGRHRVTIGTCGSLGSLAQMALSRGHFTHVIVDEAGQATEPEIMIPLTFIDKESGQIVLAGDPLQLGPVVLSKYAKEFGLDLSYLERLLERVPYQKDFDAFGKRGFDSRLITQLTYNYRSVPEVINLCSEMFYESSLVPQVRNEDDWVASILTVISDILPWTDEAKMTGGIFMYGINGTNMRAVDSPSWYNPQEATMLLLQTCKLFKRNILPDDIGIITPYIAQIKHLRNLFESTGTPRPKIGSVEEFQGQERKIILLSTVRSSEMFLEADYKFSLGFVKSPKRLNVALTRAQIAVVLFGDPHLLSRDNLWRKVINNVVSNGRYVGCNLPSDLECLKNVALS